MRPERPQRKPKSEHSWGWKRRHKPKPVSDVGMPDEEADADPSGAPWLLRAGIVLGSVALFVAGGYWLHQLLNQATPPQRAVQQIALLKQPPPPPPKPPEKPPEPPKVKDEVKIDQPKELPKPDEPKAADDKPVADKPLGVDADGSAGSDGFGLAANKGGREITSLGGGGGNARYFTGLLQRNFFEQLARSRKLPTGEFSVVVSIWLGDDGRVQRTQILNGSGDSQIDSLIQTTLAEMAPLRELPPANLRQVQLRLNRRA